MRMKEQIEQIITSVEVAEMINKEHNMLLRDIRRYIRQLGQSKIAQSDFFNESTYQNSQNKTLPCYDITRKGCEFIANKLTGIKGTEFTARYINRFHEMEETITNGQLQSQNEYLARAVLAAEQMLSEKDRQIKELQTNAMKTNIHERNYREGIINYTNLIKSETRLRRIYGVVKRMYQLEQEKGVY